MFENKTVENIKSNIVSKLPDWSTVTGSFADLLVSGTATEIWKAFAEMESLLPLFYPDETSGIYIDKHAEMYGIYRKLGTKATVTLTFTGNVGATVPARTAVVTVTGLRFLTDSRLLLTSESMMVTATAEFVGSAYNVKTCELVSLGRKVSGITGVTNASPAVGGIDNETDKQLLTRLIDYRRNPPTSGNVAHYKAWALSVVGVGFTSVQGLWNGNGTVRVVLADYDGKAVDAEVVEKTANYIATQRPIGATVTVISAQELAIDVNAHVIFTSEVTLEGVTTEFTKRFSDYLLSITLTGETVSYNKIGSLILDCKGVADYMGLTINGGTGNVVVSNPQTAILGDVVLT